MDPQHPIGATAPTQRRNSGKILLVLVVILVVLNLLFLDRVVFLGGNSSNQVGTTSYTSSQGNTPNSSSQSHSKTPTPGQFHEQEPIALP